MVQARRKLALKLAGGRRVSVNLSPDANAALRLVLGAGAAGTATDAVNLALVRLAKHLK